METKNTKLKGTSLVGGTVNHKRVENDYYATDPKSVKALFKAHKIKSKSFYEPCVGAGHISKVIRKKFKKATIFESDLVDRGCGTGGVNFLTDDVLNTKKVDWIVTNPPYKHALEFIDKSLELTKIGVAMFLKIQFLESQGRKEWFKKKPPKYVYVFSKRQDPWRNGDELNPETGKKWGSTMCFAWFVWEHGFTGETVIRWI